MRDRLGEADITRYRYAETALLYPVSVLPMVRGGGRESVHACRFDTFHFLSTLEET